MTPEPHSSSEMLEGLNLKALLSSGLKGEHSDAITTPLVPGYEILECIGRGGMGRVYKARQLSLDRLVAVKVLSVGSSMSNGDHDLLISRLESEARVMAKLSHPNLVSVYDFVKLEDDQAAIVMELITGGNVRERYFPLNSESIPVGEITLISKQVASSLIAAHAVGVIHRDIKPENLLLDSDGTVKVSDFGLALDGEAMRLTASGMSVGTIGYSAPEQIEGTKSDERADLYSLGVVMYELLTGRKPMGVAERPGALRDDLPAWLDELVTDALQPDLNRRISTAKEFKNRLESKATSSPSLRKRRSGKSRRWWLAVPALLPISVASVIYGPRLFKNDPPEDVPVSKLPTANVIRGRWQLEKDGYRSGYKICLLGLEKSESMIGKTVQYEFTKHIGLGPVALFFRHPRGNGTALVDAYRNGQSGIEVLDGQSLENSKDAFEFRLENGRRYTMSVQIDEHQIVTSINGQVMQTQPISDQTLSIADGWNWDQDEAEDYTLVIGTYSNPTTIHDVTVSTTPISREG